MKPLLLVLIIMALGVGIAQAQTATPTPTPTLSPQPSPSYTPFPTLHWSTLTAIPALSLTPRRLFTPTPPLPGTPFDPSLYFDVSELQSQVPPVPGGQITMINDKNTMWLIKNIVFTAVRFWIWLNVNYNTMIRIFRVIFIVFMVLVVMAQMTKAVRQSEEKKTT